MSENYLTRTVLDPVAFRSLNSDIDVPPRPSAVLVPSASQWAMPKADIYLFPPVSSISPTTSWQTTFHVVVAAESYAAVVSVRSST